MFRFVVFCSLFLAVSFPTSPILALANELSEPPSQVIANTTEAVPVLDDQENISSAEEQEGMVTRETVSSAEPAIKPLSIHPTSLDFGIVVAPNSVTQEINVQNNIDAMAHWYVEFDPSPEELRAARHLSQTRYLSFASLMDEEHYTVPPHIARSVGFSGCWTNTDGYPTSSGEGNESLQISFSGTGLTLIFATNAKSISYTLNGEAREISLPQKEEVSAKVREEDPRTGSLEAEEFAGEIHQHQEGLATEPLAEKYSDREPLPKTKLRDLSLAENLTPGSHSLSLNLSPSPLTIYGIKIGGVNTRSAGRNAVRVTPISGRVLAGETEKIRVTVNAHGLESGLYSRVVFLNDGTGIIPLDVHFQVAAAEEGSVIHSYVKDGRYFLTDLAASDVEWLAKAGYSPAGVAFQLFAPKSAATVPLLRLVNLATGDRFYCLESERRKAPYRYTYERNMGNIATSRLPNTKPLYRWYHQDRDTFLFTTASDTKALRNQGYIFEKTVGYVR
ncbi:MAG: hypothetical protein K9K75_05345 [Deltaproteobacteria bacterium]|nr:hypothetical protein [Deltaproteobacteria bacterium]